MTTIHCNKIGSNVLIPYVKHFKLLFDTVPVSTVDALHGQAWY